jgi:hypothetical protein
MADRIVDAVVDGESPDDDTVVCRANVESLWLALDLPKTALDRLAFRGKEDLPSAFPVTDLAAGAIGVAALALSELSGVFGAPPRVLIDRHLASLWFAWSIKPLGWSMPPPWDPISGDYRAGDGWIRLHTNASRHRAAALSVLNCGADRTEVAAAVEAWSADALEAAIVTAGGCAAAMRSPDAWSAHPQGRAVAAEALVAFTSVGDRGTNAFIPRSERPLAGLKVLDLTRVLAGPVATRFLAGYGADVLRLDPPSWDEPGVVPEVTLGKRCARLDLRESGDRAIFERLLSEADVLVHGYRPGALDLLGYGETARRAIKPDLIDVSLDAYGWTGPWQWRRGFDSLVQMSTGIAAAGMGWKRADRPTPLPVQGLDHATGYLMAAAVIRALIGRLRGEGAASARVSLARTATQLMRMRHDGSAPVWVGPRDSHYATSIEVTAWGPAKRALAPAMIENTPARWDRGATGLGSAEPTWAT